MSTKNKAANPIVSETTVAVNGTEYKIEFSMRGLMDAEDISGLSLISGMTQQQANHPQMKQVCAFFYGFAKKHTPSLTFEAVQDMVNPRNWQDIWAAVLTVYASAFEVPAPKNE